MFIGCSWTTRSPGELPSALAEGQPCMPTPALAFDLQMLLPSKMLACHEGESFAGGKHNPEVALVIRHNRHSHALASERCLPRVEETPYQEEGEGPGCCGDKDASSGG